MSIKVVLTSARVLAGLVLLFPDHCSRVRTGFFSYSRLSDCPLTLFGETGKDRLDLHALFEAAGNESAEREGVLDAIDELIRAGMLDPCGSDLYMQTEIEEHAKRVASLFTSLAYLD